MTWSWSSLRCLLFEKSGLVEVHIQNVVIRRRILLDLTTAEETQGMTTTCLHHGGTIFVQVGQQIFARCEASHCQKLRNCRLYVDYLKQPPETTGTIHWRFHSCRRHAGALHSRDQVQGTRRLSRADHAWSNVGGTWTSKP